MQIQLREDRNVREHHNPQEIIVRECEIERIRHFDAPDFTRIGIALGPIEAQELTGHSDRVQCNEGSISAREESENVKNSIVSDAPS